MSHAEEVDRAYVNGMRVGWNLGQADNNAAYLEWQEGRNREIRAYRQKEDKHED